MDNTIKNTMDNTIINENNDGKSLLVKQFNGLNIQVYGTYEEPLFKAKDVGDLLGIDQIRKTIQNLDEEDKVIKPGNTVTGLQEQWFLTENGLYEVLFIIIDVSPGYCGWETLTLRSQ